jgi:hypothetical protein
MKHNKLICILNEPTPVFSKYGKYYFIHVKLALQLNQDFECRVHRPATCGLNEDEHEKRSLMGSRTPT